MTGHVTASTCLGPARTRVRKPAGTSASVWVSQLTIADPGVGARSRCTTRSPLRIRKLVFTIEFLNILAYASLELSILESF